MVKRKTRIPLGELRCSGGVSSYYSTKSAPRVNLVTNRMIRHELEKEFRITAGGSIIFGLRYGDISTNTKNVDRM